MLFHNVGMRITHFHIRPFRPTTIDCTLQFTLHTQNNKV